VVSSRLFSKLDHYVWWLTYQWARHAHPNKSKTWVVRRYFGKFNPFRNDLWVFGDRSSLRDNGGTPHLVKFSWTNIVRHQLIAGGASPDDPTLAEYWARRRKRAIVPLDRYNLRLLTKQDARCPLCGDHLLTADQPPQSPQDWERWWLSVIRRAIAANYLTHSGDHSTSNGKRTRLVHASCYRSLQARNRTRSLKHL
jgi:RNA-directed DNA polymerase